MTAIEKAARADRQRAHDFYSDAMTHGVTYLQDLLQGAWDSDPLIQAFAAHRRDVLQSLIPPDEGMVEAGKKAMSRAICIDEISVRDILTAAIQHMIEGQE